MRVLVACEFSGVVRRAFRDRNHQAYSCDLLPCEDNSLYHFQCDVHEVLDNPSIYGTWDLMICHPPCQYLASSGAKWWDYRVKEQEEALDFVRYLLNAPVPRIALENPVGCISTRIRKQTQIIQPYEHGHPEIKTTWLWLKNLPQLKPTALVEGRRSRIMELGPTKERWKKRSRTYDGIARAMAAQWGCIDDPLWQHDGYPLAYRDELKNPRRLPQLLGYTPRNHHHGLALDGTLQCPYTT